MQDARKGQVVQPESMGQLSASHNKSSVLKSEEGQDVKR